MTFDLNRMKRALEGPSIQIPKGLSREEVRNFILSHTNMSQFQDDIKKFNGIYKLPVSSTPTLEVGVPVDQRLKDFKDILSEELNEIDEIIELIATAGPQIEILTKLTDLLGDIQVYCASEMAKFGIPLDETLAIIMQSNFSKLGADGKPIYDERGKVQKGPNYWKPEPKLQEMLESKFQTNSLSKDAE